MTRETDHIDSLGREGCLYGRATRAKVEWMRGASFVAFGVTGMLIASAVVIVTMTRDMLQRDMTRIETTGTATASAYRIPESQVRDMTAAITATQDRQSASSVELASMQVMLAEVKAALARIEARQLLAPLSPQTGGPP